MHDLSIRIATMEDAAAIARLAGELGYPTTTEEMAPRLATLLATPEEHAVLVAEFQGEVVGWIDLAIGTSLATGRYATINGLIVDERHRGTRIGEKLVHAGEAWTRDRGMQRIRVLSNVIRERTHQFYERLGYVTKKTQKNFDKDLT